MHQHIVGQTPAGVIYTPRQCATDAAQLSSISSLCRQSRDIIYINRYTLLLYPDILV